MQILETEAAVFQVLVLLQQVSFSEIKHGKQPQLPSVVIKETW